MTLRMSTAVRNLIADAFGGAFDSTGRINVYTGSQPASAADSHSDTLLATLTLAADSFAAASGGTVAANAIASDTAADAAGHPGWLRLYRTGDTAPNLSAGASDRRVDLSCGVSTLLNGAINSSVTTITVDSTLGFPASGEVLIDSERISYTGTTATTFTGCTRGVGGTVAASHSDNAVVYEYGVDATFDNATFSGSGATAGFVLNGTVSMSSLEVTFPAG